MDVVFLPCTVTHVYDDSCAQNLMLNAGPSWRGMTSSGKPSGIELILNDLTPWVSGLAVMACLTTSTDVSCARNLS